MQSDGVARTGNWAAGQQHAGVPMAVLIGPMAGALLVSGASTACGFAAVGVALYPHPAQMAGAAALFAGFGFVTGALRMALPMAFDHLPAQARLAAGQSDGAALSPLAAMAQATLTAMQAPRAARPAATAPAVVAGVAAATSPLADTAAPAAAPQPLNSETVGA
jgi:hypothetical protein